MWFSRSGLLFFLAFRLFGQVTLPLVGVGAGTGAAVVTLKNTSVCNNFTSGSTCTITTSGSHHALVIAVRATPAASGAVSSITDSTGSDTYVAAGGAACASYINYISEWYTPNTASAVTSITLTTGGASWSALVYELGGTNLTSPLDLTGHQTQADGSSTLISPTFAVSAHPSEFIVVQGSSSPGTTGIQGGNPFTDDTSLSSSGAAFAHLITSTTGSYDAVWTFATTAVDICSIGSTYSP